MALWICSIENDYWRDLSSDLKLQSGDTANLYMTERRDQTMFGFGGCFNELGWQALGVLSSDQREKIMWDLFDPANGCRFSLCRVPIGASDYAIDWYSANEHDNDFDMNHFSIDRDRQSLIPFIRAAMKYQSELRLFASPWSPPTWMKTPRAYNYGKLNWNDRTLNAYALYLFKFVQAYRDEGLRVVQVHVQNEPNSDQKFPSCLWTGDQFRQFIAEYVGPLFERERCNCEIWAGTIERPWYDQWAHLILSDDHARRYVKGIGYQWAGQGAVQRTHSAWPEVPIIQTENECGDGRCTWDYALYVFTLIQHYIVNGAGAYIYWNMVLAPEGRSTWGWRQNSMITVDHVTKQIVYQPEFYVMKHLSRYVDTGAIRLELAGPWAGNALAFENPNHSLVFLVSNPFNNMRNLTIPACGKNFCAILPPRSIHTFVLE